MNKYINTVLFVFCICATISAAETTSAPNSLAAKPTQPIDSSQQIADMIVNSKIPVLVDFWAPWCGPCRLLNPIIKQLEKDYDKKVYFVKVNIDVHRSIAAYFNVNAIPAVFMIKDKTVLKMLPGLQPRETYVEALNEVLIAPKPAPEKPVAQ